MYRDPWTSLGDMYPDACPCCAGMGSALRWNDVGRVYVWECECEKGIEMSKQTEITAEQWAAAKAHFDWTFELYKELLGTPGVTTGPAIMGVFEPLLRRYNSGERTLELYDEMMEVE